MQLSLAREALFAEHALTRLRTRWLPILAAIVACAGSDAATTAESITTIEILDTNTVVGVGATRQLAVNVRGADGALLASVAGLQWMSSDATIASVDSNGLVRGLQLGGPVLIIVSKATQSDTARVTVTPDSIAVTPVVSVLQVGQSVQLSAVALDHAGSRLDAGPPSWSVGNVTISGRATLSSTGLLTASGPTFLHVNATIAGKTQDVPIGIPGPYDGSWGGPDGWGFPVYFVVQFGSVAEFSHPSIPLQGCATTHSSAILGAPIIDNQFSTVSSPTSGGVSGTFANTNSMSGSYGRVTLIVACDNGTTLGTGLNGSTFSASR